MTTNKTTESIREPYDAMGPVDVPNPPTARATLADVQPGGRVRLGDQAEQARFEEWARPRFRGSEAFDRIHDRPGGWEYNGNDVQAAWAGWQAALSAQPSPGGQGDAVHCGKCKGRGYVHVDVDVDDSGGSIGNLEACPHCAIAAPPSRGGQDVRAQFEAWMATQHDQGSEHVMATVSATDDRYQSPVTSSMWSAWQAANAAREGGRINGWRMIDGVRVYSAYAHASILDDQQYVRYEDYLAALSAQPSPGGQGDAVKPNCPPPSWMFPEDERPPTPVGWSDTDWVAHLESARQPVREPVTVLVTAEMLAAADAYHDSAEYRSGQFSDSHTNAACYRAMAAAAPPAQAVDLADFKALYRAYVRLLESGRDRIRDLGGTCDPVDVMEANDVDLQAARRVLDSQAVGNG